MSFVTNYSNEDLNNFEKINTFKNGPFKIDEWIEYTKKNKGLYFYCFENVEND